MKLWFQKRRDAKKRLKEINKKKEQVLSKIDNWSYLGDLDRENKERHKRLVRNLKDEERALWIEAQTLRQEYRLK